MHCATKGDEDKLIWNYLEDGSYLNKNQLKIDIIFSFICGGDEIEGDGSQLDMEVLDFNRVKASVGKGREGKSTKHFATEKQRREQLNGKYKILRSEVPTNLCKR